MIRPCCGSFLVLAGNVHFPPNGSILGVGTMFVVCRLLLLVLMAGWYRSLFLFLFLFFVLCAFLEDVVCVFVCDEHMVYGWDRVI